MKVQDKQRLYSIFSGIFMFVITLSIMIIAFVNAIKFTSYPFSGFFFLPNLYVSFTERDSWEGMKNKIKPLNKLIAIDGKQVDSGRQALDIIQTKTVGTPVKYTFQNRDETKNVVLKTTNFSGKDFSFTFLLPFLIGLFFLVTGFMVFILNPLKRIAFVHFFSSLIVALFYSTVLDSNTTYWFYRLFALYPLFGAGSVHLILLITASNFLKKYPFVETFPYLLAFIPIGFQEYYLYSDISAKFIYMISPMFLVGCVILNLVYLLLHYMTTQDLATRRRTRFYLIALIFATIIPSLWSISFLIGKPLLSLDLAIVLSIFYPVFTGYAITREDLFNLESIVRTSLEYIVFTGIILGAYFILVAITSLFLQKFVANSPIINISITILVVALLAPLRNKVQNFIDRTFYPERFNTLEKINEVTKELSLVRDRKSLGLVMSNMICPIIGIREAGLLYPSYKNDKISYYSSNRGYKRLEFSYHVMKRLFPHPGAIEYIDEINSPPRVRRKDMSEIFRINPKYLIPIGENEIKGVLVIGEKIGNDQKFIHDDFIFLKSLYPQLEIALENAELHEEKAEKERLAVIGEVSSVIIHEIKNPLGIIKVSSSTLKKRINDDSKNIELIGFIEEEVNRMNDTICSFLNFAKPKDAKPRIYSIEEFSAYVENIRREIEKDKYKLNVNIEHEIRNFKIDPDHLKQMLLNLLINARDSMPEGGIIELELKKEEQDKTIALSVLDNGPGISDEIANKLFEPFFTTKQHGTGLGLSVTRQLAQSNGGDIKWFNRPDTSGACFTITLGGEENAIGNTNS